MEDSKKSCSFLQILYFLLVSVGAFFFSVSFAQSTSSPVDQQPADKETKKDMRNIFDISCNLCSVLQTSLGDGPHETEGSAKIRMRIDTHVIPEKLDFILRIQNAIGEYFLGPGQLYAVNNISTDKPSGNAIPRGNALVDYVYLCWKPCTRWELALGILEPWCYDMYTKEGIGGWINGQDDHGTYLHNVHFLSLGGFKPSLSKLFRSVPTFSVRYDPFEVFRFRGFMTTTEISLFNPEWELSKHTPDYNSYFFELEYRGKVFGKESSYRIDIGWVDTNNIPHLSDPENYGFSWGATFSQRLFSDHLSLNAFYCFSDETTANKWVDSVREEKVVVFTIAWGGAVSPKKRFYNYFCKHLLHAGLAKTDFYKGSFVPLDFGNLNAMTPIIKDEYVFEILYLRRMTSEFSWNIGFQIIKNPGAGHENWMFIPEIGISINF